jgi:dihydrofolate synthase/folylpolyglutamate synthase
VERYLNSLEKFGINLGLARIRSLMKGLDNPQQKFRSLHVAGTNGKGSTCAMIASILKEAGLRVGLYTSPHLFSYRERIKINGRDISQKDFDQGLKLIRDRAKKLKVKPTVFEALTALSFWCFAKEKVDYAVVEVGMGGRLDATNIITPESSVITNIELEHTAILGKTLSMIAREKAAIIKPGVPAVTAENKPVPLRVMKKAAQKNGSLLVALEGRGPNFCINLIGTHQRLNAACALVAIRLAGIKVGRKAIARGLKKVVWPARFQIVTRKPLTIVDGAHNPAGIMVLKATLRRKFPGKKFVFLLGVQQDKDVAEMVKLLSPLLAKLIPVRSSHQQARRVIGGTKTGNIESALSLSSRQDRVITGSLFLAADALRLLDQST